MAHANAPDCCCCCMSLLRMGCENSRMLHGPCMAMRLLSFLPEPMTKAQVLREAYRTAAQPLYAWWLGHIHIQCASIHARASGAECFCNSASSPPALHDFCRHNVVKRYRSGMVRVCRALMRVELMTGEVLHLRGEAKAVRRIQQQQQPAPLSA